MFSGQEGRKLSIHLHSTRSACTIQEGLCLCSGKKHASLIQLLGQYSCLFLNTPRATEVCKAISIQCRFSTRASLSEPFVQCFLEQEKAESTIHTFHFQQVHMLKVLTYFLDFLIFKGSFVSLSQLCQLHCLLHCAKTTYSVHRSQCNIAQGLQIYPQTHNYLKYSLCIG